MIVSFKWNMAIRAYHRFIRENFLSIITNGSMISYESCDMYTHSVKETKVFELYIALEVCKADGFIIIIIEF